MDADVASELINVVSTTQTYEYCIAAAVAMLLYDSLLTLDAEVRFIWARRLSITSLLYLVIRYVQIVVFIPTLVQLPMTDATCFGITILTRCCTLLPYLAWAVFSALRLYALTGRKASLSILAFVLNAALIIPDMYLYTKTTIVASNLYGCGQNVRYPPLGVLTPMLLVTRASTVLGESMVIVATLKLAFTRRMRSPGSSGSLIGVLLSNSIICFSLPLVLNVLSTVFALIEISILNDAPQIIVFGRDVLTSILMSHFILNIAKLNACYNDAAGRSNERTTMLTTQFAPDLSDVTYRLEPDQPESSESFMLQDRYHLAHVTDSESNPV
ncbi:hypothetical protein C8Q74DRAFT_1279038 [Fomes fomentarius]|nr:hypothetical protein C8Q74DRAFT_1279038 [Fomes fomentarius]